MQIFKGFNDALKEARVAAGCLALETNNRKSSERDGFVAVDRTVLTTPRNASSSSGLFADHFIKCPT